MKCAKHAKTHTHTNTCTKSNLLPKSMILYGKSIKYIQELESKRGCRRPKAAGTLFLRGGRRPPPHLCTYFVNFLYKLMDLGCKWLHFYMFFFVFVLFFLYFFCISFRSAFGIIFTIFLYSGLLSQNPPLPSFATSRS